MLTLRRDGHRTGRSRRLAARAVIGATALTVAVGVTALPQARGEPAALLSAVAHPKFVQPLPNPLAPGFVWTQDPGSPNHYEIGAYQVRQSVLGPGFPDTTVWGYGNNLDRTQPATYPGRTFQVQKGTPITVTWTNNLIDAEGTPLPPLTTPDPSVEHAMTTTGVPLVAHVHGGHTESVSDGLPDFWFTPGYREVGPLFTSGHRLDRGDPYVYANDQQAGTLWYHDHALGYTRQNVYAGLAGFYLVRDQTDTGLAGNPLGLPAYPYEVPIVIQDRMFTSDGQLSYPNGGAIPGVTDDSILPEMFGDFIVVNGTTWPYLNVEPRKYRLRLLNGSDSRFYTFSLATGSRGSGPAFSQIGTDDALLYAPVTRQHITLGPGERADVIVDFSGLNGRNLVMRNTAKTPYPMGLSPDPRTTGRIMQFRVGTAVTVPDPPLPATLRPAPIARLTPTPGAPVRKLLLYEGEDEYGRILPMLGTAAGGAMGFRDPITETPALGSTEVWEFYNTTEDAHPIHLHLVSFQILSRQRFSATQDPVTGALTNVRLRGSPRPPAPGERGWKDTAQMFPGEVTRIIATFDRPGLYVWHCHILSHEEHDMMRPFRVI